MKNKFRIMSITNFHSGDYNLLAEGEADLPSPLPKGKELEELVKAALFPTIKAMAASNPQLLGVLIRWNSLGSGVRPFLVLYDGDNPECQLPIGIQRNTKEVIFADDTDDTGYDYE